MKSKIIIENEDQKEEYNVLLKVEIDKKNYVIYTDGEKNPEGETIAYAGIYQKERGKQVIEPVEDDYTLEFLDSLLIQVQNHMNKDGEET